MKNQNSEVWKWGWEVILTWVDKEEEVFSQI